MGVGDPGTFQLQQVQIIVSDVLAVPAVGGVERPPRVSIDNSSLFGLMDLLVFSFF